MSIHKVDVTKVQNPEVGVTTHEPAGDGDPTGPAPQRGPDSFVRGHVVGEQGREYRGEEVGQATIYTISEDRVGVRVDGRDLDRDDTLDWLGDHVTSDTNNAGRLMRCLQEAGEAVVSWNRRGLLSRDEASSFLTGLSNTLRIRAPLQYNGNSLEQVITDFKNRLVS